MVLGRCFCRHILAVDKGGKAGPWSHAYGSSHYHCFVLNKPARPPDRPQSVERTTTVSLALEAQFNEPSIPRSRGFAKLQVSTASTQPKILRSLSCGFQGSAAALDAFDVCALL